MSEEKKFDPYTGYEIKEDTATKGESVEESTVEILDEQKEESTNQQEKATQDVQPDTTAQSTEPQVPVQNVSSLPIVSMILGIVGIVMLCCCTPFSFVVGVVALILGIVAPKIKEKRDGKAIAGIVCGIISVVLSVLIMVVAVVFMGTDTTFQRQFQREFPQQFNESPGSESEDF